VMNRVLLSRKRLVVFGGGPGYVEQLGNWGKAKLALYLINQLDLTAEKE